MAVDADRHTHVQVCRRSVRQGFAHHSGNPAVPYVNCFAYSNGKGDWTTICFNNNLTMTERVIRAGPEPHRTSHGDNLPQSTDA